ncbi:MAG: vitamin K epoxide reductase family protein [Sphingobacteriia bacterium]|jgi:uncharacterized membrane protein
MISGLIFKSMYENQVQIVDAFIKAIKIKVSLNTINQTLHEHPDYPSFLSISDSLKKWNIDCLALQTNAHNLLSIPTPFITNYKNGQFIVVKELLDNEMKITNQHGNIELINTDQFLAQWSETIIVAESNENSGEKNYDKKQRTQILNTVAIALIPLGIIVSVLVPFINGVVNLVATLYLFAKLIGLTTSVLLLWYDIDKGNPLLKQICSGIQKTNCSAVLNTKAASIGGIITWSEVGYIYFASSLLFSAFAGINTVLPLLNIFSILALPYIVFSIYYQWKIVKQWCLLCLAVQSVLLLEGVLTVIDNSISYTAIEQIMINNWSSSLAALLMPIAIWFLLKPILKRNQAAKYEKRSYLQLKYNEQVFTSLLQKQPSILAYPTEGLGITIGNPNATKTIVKVCNPFCGPCATAHPELEKIVKENPSIKAQIIFTTTNNENDRGSKPVKHLLAIAAKGDEILMENALDDWYLAKEKDYEQFANKYPLNGELQKQTKKIDLMKSWCDKVKIQYTPTIFIDGYELPKNYQLKDVNYFFS